MIKHNRSFPSYTAIIKDGLEPENKKLHSFAIHLGVLEEIGKVLNGQLLPVNWLSYGKVLVASCFLKVVQINTKP